MKAPRPKLKFNPLALPAKASKTATGHGRSFASLRCCAAQSGRRWPAGSKNSVRPLNQENYAGVMKKFITPVFLCAQPEGCVFRSNALGATRSTRGEEVERIALNALRGAGSLLLRRRRPLPGPDFRFRRQPFRHRVVGDIRPSLIQLTVRADPMIEKIGLPTDSLQTGGASFPVSHHPGHRFLPGKRKQRVQMVRHQHNQMTAPNGGVVLPSNGCKQPRGQRDVSQRSRLCGMRANPHMKDTAGRHPRRHSVMKSRREIASHRCSSRQLPTFGKPTRWGQRVPPGAKRWSALPSMRSGGKACDYFAVTSVTVPALMMTIFAGSRCFLMAWLTWSSVRALRAAGYSSSHDRS